jgi:hypothetical protein
MTLLFNLSTYNKMVEKRERKKRVTKQKQKQKQNVTVNINSNNKAPKRITRGTTTQSRFSPITVAPNIMLQPNPQPQYNPNEFHTVNTMLKELHNEIANLKIHNPLQAPLIQQQGMEVEKILINRGNQTIDNKARNKNQETQATPLTTEINTQVSPSTTEINTQTNNSISSIETQTTPQGIKRSSDYTVNEPQDNDGASTSSTPLLGPSTPQSLSTMNSLNNERPTYTVF